jgi:hypothetical protein
MVKIEEKFFVINLKHINELHPLLRDDAHNALDYIDRLIPNNEYYVCNQDEPYADEVLRVILEGEEAKQKVDFSDGEKVFALNLEHIKVMPEPRRAYHVKDEKLQEVAFIQKK